MPLTVAFLAWVLVAAGVVVFFTSARRALFDDGAPSVEHLGSWLTGGPAPDRAWAGAFLVWFDRLFRVRTVETRLGPIALPSFWRSVGASLLSLVVLTVIWGLQKDTISFGSPGRGLGHVGSGQVTALLGVYGALTLVTNWIPDYLSLVESRFVLARLAKARGPLTAVAWLLVDLVLTLSISLLFIWLAGRVALPFLEDRVPPLYVGCLTAETFDLHTVWTMFVAGLRMEDPPAALNYDAAGIYIYSTFLTSLWVWLFWSAGKLVRAVATFMGGARSAIASKPVFALAVGAALLVSSSFWGVVLVAGVDQPDVWIVWDLEQEQTPKQVERTKNLLELQGLRVVATPLAEDSPELRSTPVVVVISPDARMGHYRPDGLVPDLHLMVTCGERARRSFTVHGVEEHPRRIVARVLEASLMLRPRQLARCREMQGLPPIPAVCTEAETSD